MMREKGWECPRCERVWAPKISACGACNIGRMAQPQMPRWHIPTPVTPLLNNPEYRVDLSYRDQGGDPA